MEQEPLSPEQVEALKELANNLMAMNRVRKMLTTTLLWFAGIVTAGLLLWNTASNFWGKH